MSKPQTIIISIVVCILIATGIFVGGWYAKEWYDNNHKPEVVIDPVGPTISTVNYVPTTSEEWEQWKQAKLLIQGKIEGDFFRVTASDGFKTGVQLFKIKIKPKTPKHIINLSYVCLFGYGYDKPEIAHGAYINYSYMIIPLVGISAGVLATQKEVGASLGITFKID